MNDFTKYTKLRDMGASAADVWVLAAHGGVDHVTRIRLIREVFSLSLVEAKAVSIKARSGVDLAEHQEELLEGLNKVLDPEK